MYVLDYFLSLYFYVINVFKRIYSVDFGLNIVFLLDFFGVNKTKVW